MQYTLNLLNENFKQSEDIDVLNNACEYYSMLQHYLETLLITEDFKLFYRLINECYTLKCENDEFTKECESLLKRKVRLITTEIRKYDKTESLLEPVYNEVWSVIPLKDMDDITRKTIVSKERLEKLCNNHSMVVIDTKGKKYIENVSQKYVNLHNNFAYYMGSKVNLNVLPYGYLSSGIHPKPNSYFYIENYEPLVNAIKNKYFNKKRLKEDLQIIRSNRQQYLLLLRNQLTIQKQKTL